GGGEGANCWYRVTISERRNREGRRTGEAVGHAVSRRSRSRYGAMMLPRGLKRGAWPALGDRDRRPVMQAVGFAPGETQRSPRAGGAGMRNRAPDRPKSAAAARRSPAPRPPRQQPGGQPDPMKTSVGYIGADSLARQRQ